MLVNKIIIWGHKLHSHTHSYIHYGFFKAFKYLEYDTYWFDDNDKVDNFDFRNSLFLTEHQVDNKIPKRNDCIYFVHNMRANKYLDNGIDRKNLFSFQVFSKDCETFEKISDYEYYLKDSKLLFIPWATDLLPFEIEKIENDLKNNKINSSSNVLNFVGFMVEPWDIIENFCKQNKIQFIRKGATFNANSPNNMSTEQNIKLIQESIVAPAVQRSIQVKTGYIPCRIFKNISYGRMGITNNPVVYNLFDKKLIYNENVDQLMSEAILFEKNPNKNKIILELMEEVKNKHTYINRINTLKFFFGQYGIIL